MPNVNDRGIGSSRSSIPSQELSANIFKDQIKDTSSQSTTPVWKGPLEDGITSSLLSRFIVDRERFRLYAIEGLTTPPEFNHRLEYGNLWHTAEETYSASMRDPTSSKHWKSNVGTELWNHTEDLCARYPYQQEQVEHWYNVCKTQFPVYVDFWDKVSRQNPSPQVRTPLLQEEVFDVLYTLPSGREVRLRGKWDKVEIVKDHNTPSDSGIWIQENKTKGDIQPLKIQRQLKFDLQTMIYFVALQNHPHKDYPFNKVGGRGGIPLIGVRYNVVRRPLSGGKYSIVRHKATTNRREEPKAKYYERLGELIKKDPQHFFMRWEVKITQKDVDEFKRRFLNPVLEDLSLWYEWMAECKNLGEDPFSGMSGIHWQLPYGVYNPILEGGSTDLDTHLETGSIVGLVRTDNLFPELIG